jgi:hypothetical protein
MCPTCGDEPGMEGFQGGDTVDISEEFLPYAAAHAAWTDCMACGACIYGLDIGIGSVSPINKQYLPLQRHFRVLTKFAHVESRLSECKRQREVVFYAPVNLCDRRACSASVAVGLLCDRMHRTETISIIRLTRGKKPWSATIYFDVSHVNYGSHSGESTLWLPWLQCHYFEPFGAPQGVDWQRLTRIAEHLIPFLCENALAVCEYAWPLRRPYDNS